MSQAMDPMPKSCEVDARVSPRASKNRVEVVDGQIKIRVTAPPVDGEANKAVCETLAKALGLGKSAVSIGAGHTSRNKRIGIVGMDVEEVMNCLRGATLL